MKDIRTRVVLLALILAAGFAGTHAFVQDARIPIDPGLRRFPKQLAGWNGSDSTIRNNVLLKLRVDDYLMREYVQEGRSFWVYVGYYRDQTGGRTLHSPKHCYPASGWQKVESSIVRFRVDDVDGRGTSIPVNRYLVEKDGEQELIYYWYQCGSGTEASEIRGIASRFWTALTERRLDGALVRISTRIRTGDVAAGEKMREVVPLVHSFLDRNLFRET